MIKIISIYVTVVIFSMILLIAFGTKTTAMNIPQKKNIHYSPSGIQGTDSFQVNKSDEEWKKTLTPIQYKVLRGHGTEAPFENEYHDNKKNGIYKCAGCGQTLFSSENKYDSGTGWPSFWAPVSKESVTEEVDDSKGMERTEVVCSNCGGHLGHVFDDGPKPTGLRYCMNSAALTFEEK